MKKSVIIFSALIVSLCLMAFGYINWGNTVPNKSEISCNKVAEVDLVYNVDSRFINQITREELLNAKSIVDILPKRATKSIVSYHYSRISILDGSTESEASEIAENEILTEAQLTLLKTTDYSTNIYIRSDYVRQDDYIGALKNEHLTYYITILPENEAEFDAGNGKLIEYLKENSREKASIIKEEKLQPARVHFTITKEGKIEDVKLTSTCGYDTVDHELVDIIKNMPEKWTPATNAQGENVNQELVFFFGKQGC